MKRTARIRTRSRWLPAWAVAAVFGAVAGLAWLGADEPPEAKAAGKPPAAKEGAPAAEKPVRLPYDELDGIRCWSAEWFRPWIRAEVAALREKGKLVPKDQLLKPPAPDRLPVAPATAVSDKPLTPVEIADRLRASTVLVIALNAKGHDNFGAGFAVADDLVVTNWHVFGLRPELPDVVAVDETGKVLPVTAVAAARPEADLVVLRVRGKLPALPVAAKPPRPGEELWQMGHTHMSLWAFTAGMVRRYCVENYVPDGAKKSVDKVVMDISHDVSKGSSGSAMVNDRCEVGGVYYRSRWYYQDESNRISAGEGNNLVLKDRYVLFKRNMCIPLRSLRELLGLEAGPGGKRK